jgi:LysR family transcriptional regulator, transcription activator of glutamate synthase operon
MELRQLRYVEAIARHRHFTRAAEELHVAQSALSHQIRRLAAELGTELFARTSRTVIPTEAGEAVAARARRVLAEVEGVREEVDDLQGLVKGRVTIGALLPAGAIDVPALLARFSHAHPGVDVALQEGTAGDMLRYLSRDEIDVAFALLASDPPEGLAAEPVSTEELVATFPPGTAPGRGAASAATLAGRVILTPRSGSATMKALDDFFAAAGKSLHVSCESADPFLLRCLASAGFGTAVLPRSLIVRQGPPVDVRALRPAVRLPVALLWRRDRRLSPAARTFLEYAREAATNGKP